MNNEDNEILNISRSIITKFAKLVEEEIDDKESEISVRVIMMALGELSGKFSYFAANDKKDAFKALHIIYELALAEIAHLDKHDKDGCTECRKH